MKRLLPLLLFCSTAHAAPFTLYLPDPEAQQLIEVLSRDDLTKAERLQSFKFLAYGLQSYPGMDLWPEVLTAVPKCRRPEFSDNRSWRQIKVDAPAADATPATLASLLRSIERHTVDGGKALTIEWLAVLVTVCGQ